MIQRWRLVARWRNARAVLADAWPAMVVVFGVMVACAIGYWSFRQNLSAEIACAGMILQWFGLSVVAWGIVKLRQRFKRPSWFGRLWSAVQRPRDLTTQLTEGVMMATGQGTATLVLSLVDATIEQRLNAVEATVKQLRTDLNEKAQALTTSVEAVKQGVRREAENRAAVIRDVLRQFEDVSAGGIHLESIGLCWLFVGVLFTSLPNELARRFDAARGKPVAKSEAIEQRPVSHEEDGESRKEQLH
jgi:hypothetical protein